RTARRWSGYRGAGRARKSRRGRRLHDVADGDVRMTRDCMLVRCRFVEREHGRKARVGTLEDAALFVARAGAKHRGNSVSQRRPARTIVLLGQMFVCETETIDELRIELR